MNSTVEMETKIAFLEKHINELSDVVYRQQQEIDKLTTTIDALKDQVEMALENSHEPANEKPPHY